MSSKNCTQRYNSMNCQLSATNNKVVAGGLLRCESNAYAGVCSTDGVSKCHQWLMRSLSVTFATSICSREKEWCDQNKIVVRSHFNVCFENDQMSKFSKDWADQDIYIYF